MLTINYLYMLIGEMGDLHPPKDESRREIALSHAETTELRQQALRDALTLSLKGAQLSPQVGGASWGKSHARGSARRIWPT